ncbi:hypothetical protein ELI54_08505 [Rhizobium ruizarguesonis]|uniref:hypothetical protein n=1 Tax=Rhizobium ruizarguesonis TaxID=2081791 RepID=UPI0010303154|nr:hypothetical protein [Rhizobium ruizarguesonis]TAT88244.1 hypothetical protein ELI54_08505 [Rhizobium ruizarguesonis]
MNKIEEFFVEAIKPRSDRITCKVPEGSQWLEIAPLEEGGWRAVYYAGNPNKSLQAWVNSQEEAVEAIRKAIAEREQARLAQNTPNVVPFVPKEQRYYEPDFGNMAPALPLVWLPTDWPLQEGEEAARNTNFGPFMLSAKRCGDEVEWTIVCLERQILMSDSLLGYRWELAAAVALSNLPKAVDMYIEAVRATEPDIENTAEISYLLKTARIAAEQQEVRGG